MSEETFTGRAGNDVFINVLTEVGERKPLEEMGTAEIVKEFIDVCDKAPEIARRYFGNKKTGDFLQFHHGRPCISLSKDHIDSGTLAVSPTENLLNFLREIRRIQEMGGRYE